MSFPDSTFYAERYLYLDISKVGPRFKTQQGIINYVESSIPESEHREIFIREELNYNDGDGFFECEPAESFQDFRKSFIQAAP